MAIVTDLCYDLIGINWEKKLNIPVQNEDVRIDEISLYLYLSIHLSSIRIWKMNDWLKFKDLVGVVRGYTLLRKTSITINNIIE
jgi:hypothetical protein